MYDVPDTQCRILRSKHGDWRTLTRWKVKFICIKLLLLCTTTYIREYNTYASGIQLYLKATEIPRIPRPVQDSNILTVRKCNRLVPQSHVQRCVTYGVKGKQGIDVAM